MMKPKVSLEVAATGREEVFAFLSLDVVHAFYDMMGLGPLLQAGLHRALRDATLVTRKEIVQALLLGEPKPSLARFCCHVENSIGAAATDRLAWWLQNVFYKNAREGHFALDHWIDVLRHCQREGDEVWCRLEFPKQLSNEASTRFATAVDVKEYHRRCERLDTQPLSDWDLHMYASRPYDFDDDLEGYGGSNPDTQISLTLRNYQVLQFWAWVLRVLDEDDQTRLRERALEIVRVEELTWIKDLVHPAELDIGL